MVTVYDKESGALLGTLTERQFGFLQHQLEEESPTDTDCYINLVTIDMLEKQGADPTLLEVLARGLRRCDEMEIRWERAR